jgi:catechol 2,3-dioxygenase-like lactoylglutathione lyase family enzyme
MTNIRHVHHTAVATKDITASVAFYRDVLGLTAGATPEAKNPLQWMYAGDIPVVHIFQPKAERGTADGPVYGNAHVAFEIADFDAAKARLEERGVEFSFNIFEDRGSRQLFFDGPDGERVELIEFM